MYFSVALEKLPFEPDDRQVIYVENQYDERINALIKNNYEQIKWTFKRADFDFVYLPMFFNDEETKEKILYYAPYLTSDVLEKAELRSTYLLNYMSHPENKEIIMPSFLYAPNKEDDEWIFQGLSIDIEAGENIKIVQWVERIISDIEDDFASIWQNICTQFEEDLVDGIPFSDYDGIESDARPEYSATPNLEDKARERLKQLGRGCLEEEKEYSASRNDSSCLSLNEISDEDVRGTLEELERNIERLRLWGIPLSALAEFVAKYETVSRLLITDDNRILLPDYNIEVTMPALYKAVFLLFIYHRKEGIVLQQLEQYHGDLVYFYCKTKNIQQLNPRQLESINRLESSWNDDGSIYVVLSRIKAAFKNAIDEHLAKYYYIVGRPGEPYNIALNPELIEWEDEK